MGWTTRLKFFSVLHFLNRFLALDINACSFRIEGVPSQANIHFTMPVICDHGE